MVNLSFVGDIFPANLSYSRNCGVASLEMDEEHRSSYVKQLRKIISENSLFIGNLESPILSEDKFSKEMKFAGHPNFIKLLKEAGVSLLSIANNHISEYHIAGIESTKKILQQEEIDYIGIYDDAGNSKVSVIEKDGLSMAFISYNAIDNQKFAEGIISVYDYKKVLKDIEKLRQCNFDYIFLILHWGDEFIHRPSALQIKQAHSFVDAGANFVICSHPHVVQPVEEYHNGLICYSLGNFVFDMMIPKSTRIGMIVDIKLSKNGFSHQERFVRIGNKFFPSILDDTKKIMSMLDRQKMMMEKSGTINYSKKYDKEKKRNRLVKRILEKYLLLRNWGKYTPNIRKEFLCYYLGFYKHGKN